MIKVSYLINAKCNNCKKDFELGIPLNKNTINMTMGELVKEEDFLCPGCKSFRCRKS